MRTCWGLALLVTLSACRGPGPEGPTPSAGLVRRHWDQACSTALSRTTTLRVSELFDTAGLGRTLAGIRLEPLPLTPPWPVYEFITRYDRRGRPVASGTWDATVDTAVARRLEAELKGRVLPLSGLLEPSGFRARVLFARRNTFHLAGPAECLPHMVHVAGMPPTGLPEGVTTWGGGAHVRPGDRRTAAVRIHVSPAGGVTRVDSVAGSSEALARVRALIPGLSFEPALTNGVAVPGVLEQSFFLPAPSGAGSPG